MACDALIKAVFTKDSEGSGQAAFEVFALFVLIGELWWSVVGDIVSGLGWRN